MRQRQQALSQIGMQRGQVEAFRQQVLNPYEQQIQQTQQGISEAEAEQARQEQYNYAVRAYLNLASGGNIQNVPEDIRQLAKEQAGKIKGQYERLSERELGGINIGSSPEGIITQSSIPMSTPSGSSLSSMPSSSQTVSAQTNPIVTPSFAEKAITAVGGFFGVGGGGGFVGSEEALQNLESKYLLKSGENIQALKNAGFTQEIKTTQGTVYFNPITKQSTLPSMVTSENQNLSAQFSSDIPSFRNELVQNSLEMQPFKNELTQNYQDKGYTERESNILASESIKRGQSFTPQEERNILAGRPIKERIEEFSNVYRQTGMGGGAINKLFPRIKTAKETVVNTLKSTPLYKGTEKVISEIKLLIPSSMIAQSNPDDIIGYRDVPTLLDEYGNEISPATQVYVTAGEYRSELQQKTGQILSIGATALSATPGAIIAAPAITRLGQAREVAQTEFGKLNQAPVEWISTVDKNTGNIILGGTQSTKTLTREFSVTGNLKATESGKIFLPEATGTSKIYGTIKVGKENLGILGGQSFETGAASGSRFVGDLGGMEFYKTLTKTTTLPKFQTYGLFGKNLGAKSFEQQINKNLVYGGDIEKQFTLGNLAKLPKAPEGFAEQYLSFSPNDLGFILTKGRETPIRLNLPSNLKRTPLDRTFAQQEISAVNIPKVSPPKMILKSRTPYEENLPLIVGGKGGAGSIYTGTGQYERTEGELAPFISAKGETKEISGIFPAVKNPVLSPTKTESKLNIKLRNIFLPRQKSIQSPIESLGNISQERLLFKLSNALETKRGQRLNQENILRNPSRQSPRTSSPKIPTFKFPNIYLPSEKLTGKTSGNLFEIFGRRYGKDIFLGTEKTSVAASLKLKSFLKNTLGASGYLTESGKPFRPYLGFEFAPSKKESFRIVQKRRYRLGTGSELSEILSAKKNKRTNGKKKRGFFEF